MKRYTGIGSRDTPLNVLRLFTNLAGDYRSEGLTLRSGAASGADSAFEKGAGVLKEIYLPWRNFNGSNSPFYHPTKEAWEMASKYHPAWERLNRSVRLLHARNCHQVLGLDLKSPSEFLVCWTPNGKIIGGTATAIKIAMDHNIPITNYGNMYS